MPFLLATLLCAITLQGAGASQNQTFGPRAATPPRDATPETKKGTAVIKGRVVTADGARPLRRVQISVSAPNSASRGR